MAKEDADDAGGSPSRKTGKNERRLAYLKELTADQLIELVLRFAGEHKKVGTALDEMATLAMAGTSELAKEARRELRRLTKEPADSHPWYDDGYIPDFSPLKRKFERLFEVGEYDALVKLGKELFERGQEQVEESRDEGETHEGIQECLKICYKALLKANLSPAEKILFAIELQWSDGYSLSEGVEEVLAQDWPADVWAAVADTLAGRLKAPGKADDYDRHATVDALADALARAGRDSEVLPLLEAEANDASGQLRLVRALVGARRLDDAERWARAGLARPADQGYGYFDQFRQFLLDIARRRKDWPLAAAYQAEEFFEGPGVERFTKLLEAARRAGCEEAVRAAGLRFLETGNRPVEGRQPPAWPLPDVPRAKPVSPSPRPAGPNHHVLLDLSIHEKRPDDVVRWYDAWKKAETPSHRGSWGGGSQHQRARVAEAISATHPEQAIALYKELIADHIAQTSPTAYEAAIPHFHALRRVLVAQGQEADWHGYLASLREEHGRKRRLMEVLGKVVREPEPKRKG